MGRMKAKLRALTVGSAPKVDEEVVEYEGAKFYVRSIPYGDKSKIDRKATKIHKDADGNPSDYEFDSFYYETRVLIKSVYDGPLSDDESELVFGEADLERIKKECVSAKSWLHPLVETAKKINKKGGNLEATSKDSGAGTSADEQTN